MRISDWSSDVCSSDLALEHGVVGVAGHLDAVAAQHVQVVLAVLAEFLYRRVSEQRRERGQHLRAVELLRHARIVVRERDIAGEARVRKSVAEGKSVSVRGDRGGGRIIKTKTQHTKN